jgi:hypothetical protein
MQRKNLGFYEQVEAVLTSAQFGDIASDHRAELEGYHGWNWAAITAVCRQVARSVVYVFDDSDPVMANKRKIARSQGDYLKALSNEHQGQILPNSHGLVKLLMRPNPSQRMDMFNWERVQQLRLHGSCIIWERPNNAGITCQRYVIPRLLAVPVKPGQHRSCPNGGVYLSPRAFAAFATTAIDEQGFVESPIRSFVGGYIPVEDLSFPKYPHPYYKGDGSSPTYAGSMWIDSLTGVDKTRMDLYRQGPFGKILIKCSSEDSKTIADLQQVINRAFTDESSPVVVIGNGESTLAELTADKMVFVENHDQLADAILGTHGIGRAMVGKQDGMTYGSLAAAIKGAISLSIQSDMDLLAGYDTIQLCDEWGENLTIEYEVPPIDDPELQEQMLAADSTKGVLTVGEYRQRRRMPLFGNEYDNYLMTPQGAVPMNQLLRASQPPAPAPALSSIVPQPAEEQSEPEDLTLAVDPTLIERVKPKFLDVLSKSGVRLVDVEDEADHCWDWSIGPDQDKLLKNLPSHFADRINKQLGREYKYGCVLLPLPRAISNAITELGLQIPSELLASGGLEDEPHVTALYGILGCELEDVIAVLQTCVRPTITLGALSCFPGGPDGVPLFASVDSPDLGLINKKLREGLPHVIKYPNYTPHATVAYVTDAAKYVGRAWEHTGSVTQLDHAIISMPGYDRCVVPLRRPYVPESPRSLAAINQF